MSFKSKFLNIVTFGHVSRKAKKEADKLSKEKNVELTLNTIKLPNITSLINILGGMENTGAISSTISTITIQIVDFSKVDFDKLKDESKRGVVRSKDSITLIVGDCAEKLKQILMEYKNK